MKGGGTGGGGVRALSVVSYGFLWCMPQEQEQGVLKEQGTSSYVT
jgi:hypothetical protein